MVAEENDNKETVLHQILRKPKYDIRMGSKKDILGNTALHYAV